LDMSAVLGREKRMAGKCGTGGEEIVDNGGQEKESWQKRERWGRRGDMN